MKLLVLSSIVLIFILSIFYILEIKGIIPKQEKRGAKAISSLFFVTGFLALFKYIL